MTDPKRLPVLYIHPMTHFDSENTSMVEVCTEEVARRRGFSMWQRIVPDVPRCATCEYYGRDSDEEKDWRYCEQTDFEDGIPQDGTGYCHMHQRAIR